MRSPTRIILSALVLCLIHRLELYARPFLERSTEEQLSEALSIYLKSRGDSWIIATDPNERYETLFSSFMLLELVKNGDFDLLFRVIDEAFEKEIDRQQGMGAAPSPPMGLPFLPRPLHVGELGGLDGTSCRSCHFNGGPDGGGTGSAIALFRGDGEHLSKSVQRDAPALMGAGYVELLAKQMSDSLQRRVKEIKATAQRNHVVYRGSLATHGVNFGWVSAEPSGELILDEIEGINRDLIVRPFGWKGRHHRLVEIADESLQLHHGLQSLSRIHQYRSEASRFLGEGTLADPDQDGVIQEIYEGHPAALAAYMALLPAPIYAEPTQLSEMLEWAEGRRWFEEVGCSSCHIPSLRVEPEPLKIKIEDSFSAEIEINPFKEGQEPRLRRVDYSADAKGSIPSGIPVFLFSDLKRHRMGTALSESRSERLPNGHEVEADEWLTRPLWGLADSAPYLHDGRAQTIAEAIALHGGEAENSRRLYMTLSPSERGQLHLFLMSLSRAPTLLVE